MLHLLPALLLLQVPPPPPPPPPGLTPRAPVEAGQTRDGAQTRVPVVGTSRLAGVVVDDKGRPVKGARVSLNGTVGRTVSSDAGGGWVFDKIPDGRYSVSASKTRYLSGAVGMRRPERSGTQVQVGVGEAKTGLSITLFSPAVITGAVYGEDGEPVQNAQVRALRYSMRTGVRRLQTSNSVSTDDRGVYRLYGLTPGDYVLSATAQNETFVSSALTAEMAVAMEKALAAGAAAEVKLSNGVLTLPGGEQIQSPAPVSFAPTYFPGVSSAASAGTITVGAGDERSGADITLIRAQTASVSGIVVSRGGPLPSNISLQLISADEASQSVPLPGTRVEPDGRFTIRNVPPGQFQVVARAQSTLRSEVPVAISASGTQPMVQTVQTVQTVSTGRAFVSVDGAPVSNVVVTLDSGRTVSGRVVFEGGVPVDPAKARFTASLQAAPTGLNINVPTPPPAVVAADGTFKLTNVAPGNYTLRVSGQQWSVKSSIVAGKDSLDFPFEMGDDDVSGATVTLVRQPVSTELSGFLLDQRSQPADAYTIVVFAADAQYWRPGSRRVLTSRPGTDGRYSVRGLPAGDYLVAAVDDIEPGTQYDPEVLRALMVASARVTIGESGTVTQDLRVRLQ